MTTSQIPEHWSPQEALAVYEFIDSLQQRLWACYGVPILDLLASEQVQREDTAQLNLFDPNDPIPF
jgi:hypothetical protein